MRVFLIALLAAISYAQTVLLNGMKHYINEVSIGTGGAEEISRRYPYIHSLVDSRTSVYITADPDRLLPEGVSIQFTEAISAGKYGAVLKARMGLSAERTIAFKIFTPTTFDNWEAENKEVAVLYYLSEEMDEVPKPTLGVKISRFIVDGREYRGFGMELFDHLDLARVFLRPPEENVKPGCGLLRCLLSKRTKQKQEMERLEKHFNPNQRSLTLQSPVLLQLYNLILTSLYKMWSLGIIHGDLHVGNILYDEENNRIKIIDFGFSQYPSRYQEKKFKTAVIQDFVRFTVTFCLAFLYPKEYNEHRTKELSQENWDFVEKHYPFMNMQMLYPMNGKVPTSREFQNVFAAFRRLHSISDQESQDPSRTSIFSAVNNRQIAWYSSDSPVPAPGQSHLWWSYQSQGVEAEDSDDSSSPPPLPPLPPAPDLPAPPPLPGEAGPSNAGPSSAHETVGMKLPMLREDSGSTATTETDEHYPLVEVTLTQTRLHKSTHAMMVSLILFLFLFMYLYFTRKCYKRTDMYPGLIDSYEEI